MGDTWKEREFDTREKVRKTYGIKKNLRKTKGLREKVTKM
jgi:hypothetical protein